MRQVLRPRYQAILWLTTASLLFSACAAGGDAFVPLTRERPLAQLPEGLTVSANPETLSDDFGVALRALAPETADDEAAAALAARPPSLTLVSPLFTLRTQGRPPAQLFLSVTAPNAADAGRYDLYAWDGQAWSFLPSQARGGQRVADVAALPQAVGLFEAAPSTPLALAQIEPGDLLTGAPPVDGLLLGGVVVQANGAVGGVLPNLPAGLAQPLYPIIRGDARQMAALIADPAARAVHIQALADFAAAGDYAGLALDYQNVADAQKSDFAAFVGGLHAQLRARGKGLLVFLDLPASLAAPLGGYDWRALGAAADSLLARLPADPTTLGDGRAEAALAWAAGEVERGKLRVATSALAVTTGADGFNLVPASDVLATLGVPQPDGLGETLYPGQPVTVTLSGQGQALDFDALAFAPRYTYQADGQTRTAWVTTPATVRQRLALAEKQRLGGVLVADLFHPQAAAGVITALSDYQAGVAAAQPASPRLLWTVRNAAGVLAQAVAQPGEPFIFVPDQAGDLRISAQVEVGAAASELGAVPLTIAAAPPEPVANQPGGGTTNTGGGNTSSGGTGGTGNSNAGSGSTGGSSGGGGTGGFVPPPPIAAGNFELGGQVPGFIAHPALMKQAGMTWVKFQVRGGGGDLIAAAKSNGFKVLLSVIGDKNRVTDPAYWDEYAAWVGGLAAQGADAIEVWNEPNIDHEWPEGQISGATYTRLLARAYAAIKAANPGTLVVSAGPAPTGAEAAFPGRVMNDDRFLAEMAAAGAANYMDCVGTHFNSGTTSPNATSGSGLAGYHYSFYFWPMVDLYYNSFGGSRPLCFTELGYLTGEGFGPLPPNFAWAANTTLAMQAQWLAESASLAASSGKVRLMIIWNVDFTVYTGDPQAGYAIVRPDGSCPACSALDAVMP